MDLSWESAALLSGQHKLGDLPTDLLSILRRGSNLEYIETVSNLALDPKYATTVFFTHEQAFVEIASRWLNSSNEDGCSALASLARILPAAPHLSTYAKAFFKRKTRGALAALASRRATALQELPKESLHTLLLALCRLMLFDEEDFAEMISPVQLQMLLKHQHLHIRYLAIRLLCLYLHASDGALASMINTYTGEGEIAGEWEEKTIDYTFFSLWEEKRLNDLELKAQKFRHARERCHADGYGLPVNRIITPGDLSGTTACICGILIPRLEETSTFGPRLVMTETITKNMRALAEGVNTSRPLLVTGCAGSGKSSVVRSVAQELGKSSSMLTLHLNEQTDAKLLIGMYASATKPGSFSWRPGVLTTAVMEGRWLIIEDLDRAPTDIISILLPLLERRELLIPHWGKTIRASPSFKILATVRSTYNTHGDEIIPVHKMIGIRHWLQVAFQRPSLGELAKIVGEKFHILQNYIPRFMDVYSAVVSPNHMNDSDPRTQFNASRQLGSQDLLRWCGRVENVLLAAGVTSSLEPITEAINDQIFLEAVDCFVGALPSGFAKTYNIDTIAQKLHMSAERVNYCLTARQPAYQANENSLQIGRIKLAKQKRLLGAKPPGPRIESSPFAMTNQVLRIIESVSVAVKQAEPCLLVGETGTGKTTIVQRLADKLNRKLTVVNLSQQSEAGDLLGGYKPVNLRSLAVPMKEEFDELLEMTFPSKRNQHYTETIGKSVTRGRWERALALWQEALRMIKARLNPAVPAAENTIQEPLLKKRKMQSLKIQKLRNRWDKFASDLQTFQMHLTSGSKGFAFSFVEGNIVKAARNGDWVLLDEINLASSDTLESLAELFSDNLSGGPSVLLTDTGDAERIRAHQDFRVFGAMNPANDVGKRDLPISLRSNFTEIYVDAPDKDFDNLVAVVKAYIGNQSTVDLRVATDIAYLYLEIKKLADENRLVDGADQKPHFSLRTLTRTLIYALDIAPMYGFRRALFEGFSMSFLTVLDRDSELLVLPLIEKHILGSHKNSKAALYQTPRLPQDGKKYVQFRHYWIVQGAAEIEEQPNYIITPFIEHNLLNLVRATSTRRFPVLLQGPTSSGKTSMIEHLARISGNKFVRINNHEHTDLQEYLGTYVSGPDGRLQFHEGILVNALREGHWVVLDELNLAPTDVLEALNRLLDDNRELLIPETQQVVRPHQNFMLFATQNPPGMYGGRKTMSRAFRNRFLELHFDDIPEDELETILRERSQIAPSFCARIVAVYKKLSILRQSERLFEQKNSFATLRDLFRWALRDADDREQLAVNGFFLLAERVRNPEERLAVKTTIEEVMKVQINEGRIYTVEKIERLLGSPIPSQGDIVLTRSMRRLFVLVTEALRNNEPVLLIGETGSGKTTICQVIAKLMNLKLHIVNAHQNMETSDLIGAQRPIRNRASVESQLVQELMAILRSCDAYEDQYGQDIVTLQAAYEALQFREPAKLPDEARFRIEKSRTRANALFEWTDGSLVHAMQNGHHFLLDEISLADDSVLERLNSVLEPDRALFLAEKGSNDALVTASPGFQFLATMNPGGDYGKRELSPALRNRFTEIWVPRASSEDEMMEIAQAKLVPSQAEFAKPMVEFASWHAAKYDILSPHISIRDLLSWIYFVNTALVPDAYLALLHGAAMVYIDGLGANPASRMSIPETAVSQERQICLLKFDTIFDAKVSSSYSENRTLSTTSGRLTIGPFHLLKASHTSPDLKYSMQAPTTLVNAMKIVRALQIRKPILLEGSPGVGKTTIVAALAQAIGTPLTRINLSDQTDLMDLFGSDVPIESEEAGHFGWSDAPFLRAMQNGEWVLLDEMNLASQTVLEGLNACLDHRGQVYISELDRTFDKHPDFVVFAAQNPYHQGGGRKGLPASFVDRFTVVYADNFTPKDLLMISKEVFPTAPSDAIELILRCFTALSGLIQQDRRVGSNGGPWEINLRDILRWLHLLTSQDGLSPMASSTSYQDLLFLQRFRTSEEAAAVSEILRLFLPNHKPRSYFQSKSDDSVEIGLGLLPRGNNSLVVSRQRLKTAKINPALAESVMLCVHNNWPCLLVGPPGSGKTTLILQLASCVGADVVELSLNSEIDTMDLVGGYEQWDPTREIAGFVKRLREYTKNTLLQQLASAVEPSHSLLQLDTNLRVPAIRLPEALRLIGKAVEDYPSSDYSDFLDQCRSLMQPSTFDSRARFEWVDGILVKALKQGKWLILDNANLCSPSVLDRLNSLLEPNGFLNVNEHRNPDGSAQVVKAHPNFRLFMTMDPCHGELSRAMRNRSIELFFPAQHPSPTVNILRPCSEPKISRFELFRAFDWSSLDELSFKEHLAICFDHLAFPDIKLFTRWQVQATLGLVDSFCFKEETFGSVARAYQQMFEDDGFVLRGIRDNYARLARTIGLSADFSAMQAIHPFNNQTLLSPIAQDHSSTNLEDLGYRLELLVDIYQFGEELATVSAGMQLKAPSQLTKLERSIASVDTGAFRNDSTQPVAAFIRGIGLSLRDIIDGMDSGDLQDRKKVLPLANNILSYVRDLKDLTLSLNLDEGKFQAYQTIGRAIVTKAGDSQALLPLAAKLVAEFVSKLDNFNKCWQLHSGLAMELVWKTFRPVTAKNLQQLERSVAVRSLADRFDSLRWSSGSSVQELCSLRQSIERVHWAIESSSSHNFGPLEVCLLRAHERLFLLTESKDIQKILGNLRSCTEVLKDEVTPYFQCDFKILLQFDACTRDLGSMESKLELSLLAGRSTAQLIRFGIPSNSSEVLSHFQRVAGTGQPNTELAAIRNVLPVSMLHKLDCVSEVPLRSLNRLCAEMDIISKNLAIYSDTICGNALQFLNHLLIRVREKLSGALKSEADMPTIEKVKGQIDQLQSQRRGKSNELEDRTQHLHRSLESCFDRQQSEFPGLFGRQYGKFAQTAVECIQFFTGCLLLYVPDRPFDPALKPKVERDRHHKHRFRLEKKLRALQDFELVFSGQKSSFRSQLVEKLLKDLGAEPHATAIARPSVSELGQLQAEFNNVLYAIVLRSPTEEMLQSVFRNDTAKVQEIELLRTNISQAVLRLSEAYRAYEDVTQALVGFLHGLDTGLALSLLVASQLQPNQNATQYMCEMTPFCGAGPHALPKTTFADLERQNREVVDLRLHFLKCFGIAHSVTQDVGETSVDTMFHSFHSLYDGWKQQLGQDQRQNAVKSSLYRYRGSEADGDDAAGEDFHNLFPDYEHRSEQFIDSTAHRPSPRDQAQQVSCLHRDIFQSPENTSLRILDLLGVTATRIAESHRDGAHLYQCPVPAATMLSALTLSLDQHKRLLCGQAEPGRQYNFYTDTNLSEVRKLLALIDDIQARFSDLQVAWPEHATLEDVLRTSSELLGLRHTEPIAKILTKAEQLHGYLHEWQLVASREYSAVTLYDQLTGLLVGWRRLELSTWARLLDMEDQRCRDHSDSWWFIAYEVIIAAPLSNINTSGDIQIHAQQLFNTLADFLHNTSMGQYSHRLGMVDCFRGHLNMLIQTIPSMGVLHNTVVNFLSYYKRFEKPIHDFLHKGRQTLEKDMKEILLFASWKDTNIIALRDSAKRCHHKLFKVIRKYRALLAQNAESVIMQEFPENPVLGIPSRLAARTTELLEVDRQAIQVCSKRIDSWDTKPERFKNPVSTVERMLAMSQPPSSAMDLASYLDTFGSGLVDNIRALQKATPSKATKENSEAIKHLKARKRKLYAETLRALRQMGLRSNMGADALARQESLSVVLTNTPALTAVSCESEASAAECYLHSLLRIMPEVKEQSRDHSEDLNHGEVARSIGYLESMLSVILKQRAVLAATSTDVDELEKTSSKLQNLWDPDKYTLKKQDHGKQAVAQATKHTLRHLPGMIEAGSVIIEKHGEMGGFDWSTILDILEEWHGKITKAIKNIDLLPQLPTQLSSSQHERIQAHSANVIHCFREQLQGLMEENPRIAFVLKQIHLWTDISVVNDDAHTNGESGASIADLDDRFSSTSDSILVAIQRFQEFSSSVPSSDEETTWLIRTDISLAISLNHLRPREINNQLAEAMSKVQHLVTSDDSQLQVAAALCAIVMPVVQQYRNIVQTALEKYAVFHRSLCKFANLLSRSFLQIVKEGFCKPAENSASETENSEKLEGGTGLGEGEGAEDISKDIQDDEDLSELAQEANKEKKKEGIEDQEDAVDMDHDELEGEMGDVSDNGEDEGSSSEPGDNEIDEEAGKIDALDPGAVDEKLWDGKAEGKEKEKGGTKQGGKVDKDEEAAADLNQQESREEVGEEEADLSQIGAEEGEQVAREETEQLDPHAQEGRNLDLPEEMDLDKADVSEVDSASVESDIEGMSDIDQDNMGEEQDDRIFDADQPSESKETIKDESSPQDHTEDSAKKEIDADRVEEAGSPMDTDPDDDELQNDDQGLLQNSTDNRDVDQEDVAPSDAVGVGDGSDRQDADERKQEGNAQGRRGTQGKSANSEEQQAEAEDGQFGPRMDNTEAGQPEKEPLNQNTGSQAFKKLGDALERWHRQNKKIQDTSEQEAKTETKRPDMKLADQDFEHLQDEAAEADTQALGAATDEQAHALDDQALNSELRGEPPDFPMDEMREEGAKDQDVAMEDEEVIQTELKQQEEQSRHGAFISNRTDGSIASRPGEAGREHDEDIHDFNNEISTTHLQPAFEAPPRSVEEARRLWSHYEMLTHRLTLSLTEQLRLILAPTIATKMRGDYRTGKRLNMKRIIPYIASQYKRDKIWMRRSVPSKRGYQIMLAVDDSKSMGESGSGQLAFETLALVSKSLSMLEVGEICIVGFGNEVDVAHEFDNPFSSEAGAQILQHFSFQQTTTNVRKLVADSITLFREARRKTTNSATDLWQLELIISDGVCEDHDGIRLLVRQAQEERIMIVFVIVDALLKAESIMDMSEAVFEPDAITGETKLKIKRYLDGFPFPYYVVVGDVRELPRVLAQALRQWFAEVVESG